MPLTTSDLIFSEQANHDFSRILTELKRSNISVRNRILSIQHDALFAQAISTQYGRPLVANERCGGWYINPENKVASAYFKSTDGHTGVWKFSCRRLNLHLLEIIGINDGCIIVDSTRRGKRMPDALSKTVPIWCAVLNRYLFPEKPQFHDLRTPSRVVSLSEHAQITALIPSFVASFEALGISRENLRKKLNKPLRPIWITPDSQLSDENCPLFEFHPVVCCTVSRRVTGGEISASGYIQGAGDDTENWALGLTPKIFWENQKEILSTPESQLPTLVQRYLSEQGVNESSVNLELCPIKPTSCLFVSVISVANAITSDDSCTIILLPNSAKATISRNKITLGIGRNKLASRNLRKHLGPIMNFVTNCLSIPDSYEQKKYEINQIIVACQTGMEYSIGVALTILCLFFKDNGDRLDKPRDRRGLNKEYIRSKLAWISTSIPMANPSHATLQSVNSYLMDWPGNGQ